jgi:hypothetical protein
MGMRQLVEGNHSRNLSAKPGGLNPKK